MFDSDLDQRPTCRLCNSDKWHGWIHDRDSWGRFPWLRDVMLKAHYPYDCGVGDALKSENGYAYPATYLEEANA